jgi:hypothetical protein
MFGFTSAAASGMTQVSEEARRPASLELVTASSDHRSEGFAISAPDTIFGARNENLGGAATPPSSKGIQRVAVAAARNTRVAGSLNLNDRRTASCAFHARDAGRG